MLMMRVNQMRSDLEWRTMQLQTEKESREQQQARNHQRGKSVDRATVSALACEYILIINGKFNQF